MIKTSNKTNNKINENKLNKNNKATSPIVSGGRREVGGLSIEHHSTIEDNNIENELLNSDILNEVEVQDYDEQVIDFDFEEDVAFISETDHKIATNLKEEIVAFIFNSIPLMERPFGLNVYYMHPKEVV